MKNLKPESRAIAIRLMEEADKAHAQELLAWEELREALHELDRQLAKLEEVAS